MAGDVRDDVKAAAERVRRVQAGETSAAVYPDDIRRWFDDCALLARAYLSGADLAGRLAAALQVIFEDAAAWMEGAGEPEFSRYDRIAHTARTALAQHLRSGQCGS